MSEPDEVDKLLDQIARAAQIDADGNYRIADNYLKHTDRVIANVATLKTVGGEKEVLQLAQSLLADPT